MDCDILAGIPFCKTNDIHVHLKVEAISIGSTVNVPYGFKDASSHANIRRIDSVLLRNDIEKVVMPGDYVEFKCKDLQQFDDEAAIEPHSSFSESRSDHGPRPRFPELLKVPYESKTSKMNLFRFKKLNTSHKFDQ